MTDKLICIGQFLGAHGVKGLVKLVSFTEEPENIIKYGVLTDAKGKVSYAVKLNSWNKTHFIASVEGVADRTQAEKLKGVKLHVPRSKLPKAAKGQYYYVDLIGLEARLEDGSRFGEVIDMKNYGAGDILEVKLTNGKKMLYPFSDAVIPQVDLEAGYLTINPPVYVSDTPDDDDVEADE